jgi:predicted Na+-dependent transporter
MDLLTLFGLFSVTACLICYALEQRSPWLVLGFCISCILSSTYRYLKGAEPFGVV